MEKWPLHTIPLHIVAAWVIPLAMYVVVCTIFDEPIFKHRAANLTCLREHTLHTLSGISIWFWSGMFMMNPPPERSFLQNALMMGVHFMISDFAFYWCHRISHCKFLYIIHAPHHTHKTTPGAKMQMNALSGTCTNFMDMMITGHLPVFIPCFVTNMPTSWMVAYVLFINFWVCAGHCVGSRTAYFPSMHNLLVTPAVHAGHHIKGMNNQNYGILLTLWDRIMGTYYEQRPLTNIHSKAGPCPSTRCSTGPTPMDGATSRRASRCATSPRSQ